MMNKLEMIEQELIRERMIPHEVRNNILSTQKEIATITQEKDVASEERKSRLTPLEEKLRSLEAKRDEAHKAFTNTHPEVRPGDTVRVHSKIEEGDKTRLQIFEGIVLQVHHAQNRTSFTVRKVSHAVGVERTFPFYSPAVEKIEIVRRGRVRRAKLYYLRSRGGKSARIQELKSF